MISVKLKMESNELIWDFGCSISDLFVFRAYKAVSYLSNKFKIEFFNLTIPKSQFSNPK
jgi:hypothetical protein